MPPRKQVWDLIVFVHRTNCYLAIVVYMCFDYPLLIRNKYPTGFRDWCPSPMQGTLGTRSECQVRNNRIAWSPWIFDVDLSLSWLSGGESVLNSSQWTTIGSRTSSCDDSEDQLWAPGYIPGHPFKFVLLVGLSYHTQCSSTRQTELPWYRRKASELKSIYSDLSDSISNN